MIIAPAPAPPKTTSQRTYKYYDLIMAAFVTVLLCTNLVSASKQVSVGGFVFGAGVLFFPISYLFGDILTEVYGYARSRKVVWAGFAALAFTAVVTQVVLSLPAGPGWPNQKAYQTVFGGFGRIAIASFLGFLCGEFTNSFTLAKMKVLTSGRWLWTRTIGSTVVGELVDSLVFYPLAFLGATRVAPVASASHPLHELRAQGPLGGHRHAADVRHRRLPQAGRARGLLRLRHRLHALLAGDVSTGPCRNEGGTAACAASSDTRAVTRRARSCWRGSGGSNTAATIAPGSPTLDGSKMAVRKQRGSRRRA